MRRANALRWLLLVLIMGGTIFTGHRSASALVAPPIAPPIAPPTPIAPVSPYPGADPGGSTDDLPFGEDQDWFWCHLQSSWWGCPTGGGSGQPEAPEGGVGNPTGPVVIPGDATGSYVSVLNANGVQSMGRRAVGGDLTGGVSAGLGPLSTLGSYAPAAVAATAVIIDVQTVPNTWQTVLTFMSQDGNTRYQLDLSRQATAWHMRWKENGTVRQSGHWVNVPGAIAAVERLAFWVTVERTNSNGNISMRLYGGSGSANGTNYGGENTQNHSTIGAALKTLFPSAIQQVQVYVAGGFGADNPIDGELQGVWYIDDLYGLTDGMASWAARLTAFASTNVGLGTLAPWEPETPEVELQPDPTPTTTPAPVTIAPGPPIPTTTIPATPEGEETDDTLAERIGGFFGGLIEALWGMFIWLVTAIGEWIQWLANQFWQAIVWLYVQLANLLGWLLGQIIELIKAVLNLMGQIGSAVITWLSGILNAIINGFATIGQIVVDIIEWLGQMLLDGINLLLQWLLDGISLLFEWLFAGITALFEFLLQGIIDILIDLFVPTLGLSVLLEPIVMETPIKPWVDEAVTTWTVISDTADPNGGGSLCGPTIDIPDPLNWTVRAPTPSGSGCAGNGPGGVRLAEDNAAGDLWGWRVPVRAFIAVFLLLGFLSRVSRIAPWSSGADQGEVDAEGALG